MNEPTIVIEPTDSAVKIVVGYILENNPVILYANSIPLSGFIKNGVVLNPKSLGDAFKKIVHIKDEKAKAKFDITSAILVIPPVGLEIYEDRKSTITISKEEKIDKFDLSNIVAMITKGKIKPDNSFVDIMPIRFYIQSGRTNTFPLGAKSNFLSMWAIINTLPTNFLKSYKASLEYAGVKVNRCVIAPCAVAHLLAQEKEIPETFLYIDVGSSYTSISLISKSFVFNSSYFDNGGDVLTQAISEAFNIDAKEAEKIKRRYGYSDRIISFNPIIVSSVDGNGVEVKYTLKDLNSVIKTYFENYLYAFDVCLNKMLSIYPSNKRDFPFIIGGAASRLDGFIKFFKEKYPKTEIRKVPLRILGTRHEKYLNCVGALLTSAKYMNVLEFSNEANKK